LNAPTSLLVLHCYLIIHLISVIVFTTINNKLKNQDTHIRWDYRKTDDFVHILSNDQFLFFIQYPPVYGVNHTCISGLTLITCYVYSVSGYFGIIIYSRETFIRGPPLVWFLLGPYYFSSIFCFVLFSLISFCFRWFRFISFSFHWFRFVSFRFRFISISFHTL
jgi:hypothetical protein